MFVIILSLFSSHKATQEPQIYGLGVRESSCHGEQRTHLWTEQGGPGEDRPEVRPRPGAAPGGLDSGPVWGQPGETTDGETQLPGLADGRNSECLLLKIDR